VARIKIRRKDLRRPDEFVEVTGRVWQWILARRRLVASVAGVTLALLAAVVGTQQYRQHRLDRAADGFRKAVALFSAGDAPAAVGALQAVTDAGPYAALSDLYRGHALLRAKDGSAAAEAFAAASEESDLPPYLRQEALYGRAFALDQAGDSALALEHYVEAAALAGPYRVDARLRAAQLTEAKGALDEARALYQLAVEDANTVGTRDDLLTLARWRLSTLSSDVALPADTAGSD
jgi:hypothetical protein